MVKHSKSYLTFLNIILTEYIEFIYELKSCYDGPPDKYVKDDLLKKYRRRIPLLKTCLENIGDKITPDFLKNCWFVC